MGQITLDFAGFFKRHDQGKPTAMSIRLHALLLSSILALGACGGPTEAPWTRQTPPTQQAAQQAPDSLDLGMGMERQTYDSPPPSVEVARLDDAQYYQPQYQPPAQSPAALPVAPIKVALLVPMSGHSANVGEAIMNASQLALFDIGADTFEIMPRDTGGTASGAAAAARTAINDGAQLILGPLFAEEARAVAPVAAQANINVISFTTDWQQAGHNRFVMGFMPFGQVQRVIQYAAANNLRNIGVVAPQNDYGNAVMAALNSAAPQAGVRIVDTLRFAPGDTGLAPAVQRFARYDARRQPDGSFAPAPFDAIFMPVGGTDALTIGNLLSYYELAPAQVRRLGTGLWDDPSLIRERSLNGGWFAAPDPRARRIFENKYREAYGETPPRLASLGYDATALAAVLARNAGAQTPPPARGGLSLVHSTPSVSNPFNRAAITNPNGFAGIDGIFRFSNDGLAERGLSVLEIRNGQTAVIDPAPQTFQGR